MIKPGNRRAKVYDMSFLDPYYVKKVVQGFIDQETFVIQPLPNPDFAVPFALAGPTGCTEVTYEFLARWI